MRREKYKTSELLFFIGAASDDLLKFFHINECKILAYLLEGFIFDLVLYPKEEVCGWIEKDVNLKFI